LDTGDILYVQPVAIDPDMTSGELFDRIGAETMQRDFEKCLTLQQQGVWMLEFARVRAER
jgi:methionyl-tRNA formyltransferase